MFYGPPERRGKTCFFYLHSETFEDRGIHVIMKIRRRLWIMQHDVTKLSTF
ncbi:hypothetical protein HMPREF3033_01318 [Veillonellaceae bacterium DNF00751]|nr:hypothetical protein HMPREF3033_01318 [Veillonellaceae bacterium DNF00751]